MHHTVEGASAMERSRVGQRIWECLGWRKAVKEDEAAIWAKPWIWWVKWTWKESSFCNAYIITSSNSQHVSDSVEAFMLKSTILNNQLGHFKSVFNQVLRDRNPEQINRTSGNVRIATKGGENSKPRRSVLLTVGTHPISMPCSGRAQRVGEGMVEWNSEILNSSIL